MWKLAVLAVIEATGHREPEYWGDSKFNQPKQPVVGVNWLDSVA